MVAVSLFEAGFLFTLICAKVMVICMSELKPDFLHPDKVEIVNKIKPFLKLNFASLSTVYLSHVMPKPLVRWMNAIL